MRSRYLVSLGALSIALPVMLYITPHLFSARTIRDEVGDDTGWKPTAVEIATAVGPGPSGDYRDDRHRRFAAMFQSRYRDRTYAVGVRFMSPALIRVMYSASIPRWDMARVAIEAATEARDLFHTEYGVDLYQTYISAPPVKMAELRFERPRSLMRVNFDPRFARQGRRAAARHSPIPMMLVPTYYMDPRNWFVAAFNARLGGPPRAVVGMPRMAAAGQ